jgi:hypothetical protein
MNHTLAATLTDRFGSGWSNRIIEIHFEDPVVWAHVRLSNGLVSHDAVGMTTRTDTDLAIHSAIDDAYELAYALFDPDPAPTAASKPDVAPVEIGESEIDTLWTNLLSISRSLDAEAKDALSAFWQEWASTTDKPTRDTVTFEDLDALIAEAARLSFGGEYVDA